MKYYIASPRSTEAQLDRIRDIESELDDRGLVHYPLSSELDPTNDMSDPNLSKLKVQLRYNGIIRHLVECKHMIAIVDNLDKLTAFKIGYFIGLHHCDSEDISKYLLMVGDLTGIKSEMIQRAVSMYKSIEESGIKFIVIDFTDVIISHILLGLCHANHIKVISWSNTTDELDSIASAAVVVSYVHSNNNNLSSDQLFYELVTNNSNWIKLFGKSYYQLSTLNK